LKKAAVEGSLAKFLDVQEVPLSRISELLSTQSAVSSLENILQTLWFGGDIEHRNNTMTPLHYASKYGTHQTVTVLLEAGAAVNAVDCRILTPLHYAVIYQAPATIRSLLHYGASVTVGVWKPVHAIATYGCRDDENLKLILEASADVNSKSDKGWTPLLMAVLYRDAMMVANLLKHGANINVKVDNKDVYDLAKDNHRMDQENVLRVLAEHMRSEFLNH